MNDMIPIPSNWLEETQRAAAMQQRSAQQLEKTVAQLANIVVALSKNMQAMEAVLKARVTITAMQARALKAAVIDRARDICEAQGFPYDKVGRTIRNAILRDFRESYGVKDVHDLPAIYYDAALVMVTEWSSFSLVRQIRARLDA